MMELKSADCKKTLQYSSWVARTVENEEQAERVAKHLIAASEKAKDYFSIEVVKGDVKNFTIDEWMALYEKEGQ